MIETIAKADDATADGAGGGAGAATGNLWAARSVRVMVTGGASP
ncbi:hypothetical protein [Nocardioides sp.]|nr:hypothetical protein [Nocardioides sp.]MDP3891511.1 hypothetical protein [Nocardioides sp.]